jgi:hypothetical protein
MKEETPMKTDCTTKQLEFQGLCGKKIILTNDGEQTSTDGGLILIQLIEKQFGIIRKLATCFKDLRRQRAIKHRLFDLLFQRIAGLIQGYEDLNDHEDWRNDLLLNTILGKNPGHCLAGKSTLNRLELGLEQDPEYGNRYNRITWDPEKIEDLLIDLFVEHFHETPKEIILDFDATDIPIHGDQESRFFNGYYDNYCYLPLYCFSGSWPLIAKLRPSNIDPSLGTLEALEKIIPRIRRRFPDVQILLRADSGFMRDKILAWCEENGVKYVIGMARNNRLVGAIGKELYQARQEYERTGAKARVFTDITYITRSSWSHARRVIAKAEHLCRGSNPRFVVTNLEDGDPKEIYEEIYCGRGDMENRIKEQQLFVFADRTSSTWMQANQLRLYFSTFAYIFFVLIREQGLSDTEQSGYQAGTIRLKILKVSAWVQKTSRAIRVRFPASFPYWDLWEQIAASDLAA